MNDEIATALMEALHRGETCAKAVLVKGNKFLGALPEAVNAGFAHHNSYQSCFITGFLIILKERYPNGILTDQDGYIIEPPRV